MKKSFLSVSVFIFSVLLVRAETINVVHQGIEPGRDVTLEVNQLIESIRDREGVTLYFPKGRYEFRPENAVETYRAVTNSTNLRVRNNQGLG